MFSLALLLLSGTSARCPDDTVHWLQPKLQGVDPGLLQSHQAENAWCYPTAAASLLGKLANDGKWNSKMKESDKYPTSSTYTSDQDDPWGDYSWHEKNALNLGHYMKTNNPDAGTTLEEGKEGIEKFLKYLDPTKKAVVTIHLNHPTNSEKYPLLLHIKTSCIPNPMESDAMILGHDKNAGEDIERINNSPAPLGHTVVAYDFTYDTFNQQSIYQVSMNLPTPNNPAGTTCTTTPLVIKDGVDGCIQNYTTVEIQDKETKSDDEEALSLGAIIGIAVGGTVLVGVAGYAIYRWRTKSGRSGSPIASAGSLIF